MPDPKTPYFAYVGSRTTRERNARGEGLSVFRVDPATGIWTSVQVLRDLTNPSFLAFDRQRRFLYTVHGDLSEISAFRIDPQSGTLTFINQESTGGRNPVHLSVDLTNRFIIVANHISSSLAVLPIGPDGALGKLCDLVTLTGKIGPHRVEQPFAKPHQVVFDGTDQFIAVPDKGLDRTFVFRIDTRTGKLVPVETAAAEARACGTAPHCLPSLECLRLHHQRAGFDSHRLPVRCRYWKTRSVPGAPGAARHPRREQPRRGDCRLGQWSECLRFQPGP